MPSLFPSTFKTSLQYLRCLWVFLLPVISGSIFSTQIAVNSLSGMSLEKSSMEACCQLTYSRLAGAESDPAEPILLSMDLYQWKTLPQSGREYTVTEDFSHPLQFVELDVDTTSAPQMFFKLNQSSPEIIVEVCVYGATPGGIAAAIAAKEAGAEVVLLSPDAHVGGHVTNNVGFIELDWYPDKGLLNLGIWKRLRDKIADHYGNNPTIPEPHVAEQAFEALLTDAGVRVIKGVTLDDVQVDNGTIAAITINGREVAAEAFVDATVEGDLMAMAGVSYTYGREAEDVYGETLAGVYTSGTQTWDISPYDDEGHLLPPVRPLPIPPEGSGDNAFQTCNFLICITENPDNVIAFERPESYDPKNYELLLRYILGSDWLAEGKFTMRTLFHYSRIPNGKAKINNKPEIPISVGLPGAANGYTEADAAGRQAIDEQLRQYIQGYFYFLQNDPRVPDLVQDSMQGYGLAKDEFVDNDGWPYRFYLREGRRMIGDWVMTQADISNKNPGKADLVSFGGFPTDSHQVYIYPTPDGKTTHDGKYLTRLTPGTYEISYRVLLPKRQEITNLLCPYATSSSSVAYNGFRMVPSWMMLGQAAGAAAALAADQDLPVQDLDVTELQDWLIDNAMLPPRHDWPVSSSGAEPSTGGPDIIIDNTDGQVTTTGDWPSSTFHDDFIGENYQHDGNADKGSKSVTYIPTLPEPGLYRVKAHWAGGSNRAANALYQITHIGGVHEARVDQRENSGQWVLLGELELDPATAQVTLRNDETDGVVIADAVGFSRVAVDSP